MKIKFLPFALAMLLAPAVFAQDYEIKLTRPKKAGEEYNLQVTGKQYKDTTTTSNGAVVQNEKADTSIQCSGVLKIIEVDAKGQETKTAFTIDKFTKTEDGKDSEVLPKGTVITSSQAGKAVHMVNDQPVDPSASELLNMVIELSKGEKADDDTVFGAKERKKKGDSWDVNGDEAMKSFEETGDGVKPGNFAGKTTLEDVTGDTLKITSHFTTNFQPPLPPIFTVDSSSLEASMSGLFPIDATKCRPEESTKLAFSFAAHANMPTGEKIEIKAKIGMESVRKLALK
jgi:hypothetical protein